MGDIRIPLDSPGIRSARCNALIQSRFYQLYGKRWEARFFRKGEFFPDTDDLVVLKQGVWARSEEVGWERAVFVGSSWRFVNMDLAVQYLPDRG